MGRRCYASVDALPEGVDVAVLAIPRAGVLDAVKGLAARKCGGVVIFAAGFAEGGEEGLAEQREIARIAHEAGMVVEGPNCLGLVNYIDRIPLTFVETNAVPPSGKRAIGIVSQSGAMAAVLGTMLLARDAGVSYSVSTGNEAASGVEDYVDWMIDQPDTHVIAMIVEQFRKPQVFLAAARRAKAAGKPVVLLHPGKSSAARESAATHTGAMAGDYKLMRAMVARAGVIFAETLEELGDIAEIAVRCDALPSGATAVLGESGAFKALTLDLAEELDLPLADLHDDDSPALRAALPVFVPVSNPLDITAQVRGHHSGRGDHLRDQVPGGAGGGRRQDADQAGGVRRTGRRRGRSSRAHCGVAGGGRAVVPDYRTRSAGGDAADALGGAGPWGDGPSGDVAGRAGCDFWGHPGIPVEGSARTDWRIVPQGRIRGERRRGSFGRG
jgi:acyl-CoA synthetase (NDP forming)